MATDGFPVVLMGLGEIGRAIARAALARGDLEIIAAVDPAYAGRSLAELIGHPGPELHVTADTRAALAGAKGAVVLHATGSRLQAILPDLQLIVRAGCSVISTCEELAYPWVQHEEAAEALDALADQRGVAILGTGVNPGFALDRLPALLAQATGPVRHVRAVRVVDASRRRVALQRKIGAGMTVEAFEDAVDRDAIGHVGLAESAALVAAGCGWPEDEIEIDAGDIEPIVADEDADGPVPVRRGQVAGFHEVVRAFLEEREVVRLELTIQLGAEDPRDELELDADPPVRLVITGGLSGDLATANLVVNAVPAVLERQGLLTVLDLPAGR